MKRRVRPPSASKAATAAMLARTVTPGPCELVATIRFTFPAHVDEIQLQEAILRAVRTHAFGIVGQCTVTSIVAPATVADAAAATPAAPPPSPPTVAHIAPKSPEPFQP